MTQFRKEFKIMNIWDQTFKDNQQVYLQKQKNSLESNNYLVVSIALAFLFLHVESRQIFIKEHLHVQW